MKMADKEGGETFDEAVEERVINEEYKVRNTLDNSCHKCRECTSVVVFFRVVNIV